MLFGMCIELEQYVVMTKTLTSERVADFAEASTMTYCLICQFWRRSTQVGGNYSMYLGTNRSRVTSAVFENVTVTVPQFKNVHMQNKILKTFAVQHPFVTTRTISSWPKWQYFILYSLLSYKD